MTSLPAFPAAQPQIPTYKRHSSIPVKPEPLKETEEDTNGGHLRMPSLPVKSEPLKETEEDKNDALRMTSLPVSAPQQRPQPPQKHKSRPVKPEPLKETDEDKNGGHLRMTSLPAFPAAQPQIPTYKRHSSIPAQPDPHKEKEEDINTSPLISAPQQRPQPPPKHTSRTGKLVQQKERQQNVNTARVDPTPLPSRRHQTQRLITDHPENTEPDASLEEAQAARRTMPCLCIILGPIFLGMFFIVCGLFGLEWHQYSTSKWR
ncbi:hypothetical protein SRHO_G00103720 [Serrasalmus rhombeus]